MIRTINFLAIIFAGLTCLGVYRVAEAARIANADLAVTQRAIVREQNALTVLQAEWAHLTQPARVAALAARHLDLTDKPAVELSSLTSLPRRGDSPLVPEGDIRTAKIVVPEGRGTPVEPSKAAAHAPAAPAADAPQSVAPDAAVPDSPVAPNTGA